MNKQTKNCKQCHEAKPLSEFHKNPCMSDGHINICKPCKNEQIRAHKAAKNGTPGYPGISPGEANRYMMKWCVK